MSAILVTEDLFHAFGLAKHGSTLGGSPLACRLGLEFLSIMEDEAILERVADTGAHLRSRLEQLVKELGVAVEARGAGLLQGIELTVPARPIVEAALAAGVMLNCVQGNVIRFLPPLIIDRANVDTAVDLLEELLISPQAMANDTVLASAAR